MLERQSRSGGNPFLLGAGPQAIVIRLNGLSREGGRSMRSSSLSSVAILAAVFGLSSGAQAQEIQHLGQLVLSGGLTPIEATRYARSYSVVTAEEIEARGVMTVQDALRSIPGVAVSSGGTNFTQVRLRGGEADHTLVLIDGVPAQGGSGEYTFANLDVTQLERIEVLRGPQSVFYGSGASTGVINLITKKASGSGYGGRAEFGNGHLASGYVQHRGAQGGLRLAYTDFRDKGYDFSGTGGEKDYTDRQSLYLDADWAVTEALTLRFGLTAANTEYAYDYTNSSALRPEDYGIDTPDGLSWREERTARLGFELGQQSDRLIHNLDFSRTESRSKWAEASPWSESTTETVKLRSTYGFDGAVEDANHFGLFMLEHYRDGLSNGAIKRHQNAVAFEYRGQFDNGLDLQAGLRHDHDSLFGNFLSWNAGLSYALNDSLRLHGSLGRAYVKPSSYQMENKRLGADLRPEENRSIDFGLAWDDGAFSADVTAFYGALINEITYIGGWPSPNPIQYFNEEGKGHQRGIEASGRWQLDPEWDLAMAYTYLKADKPDGSVAVRRPQHEIALSATWTARDARFSGSGTLRHVAGLYDRIEGNGALMKMEDFTTLDLAGHYRLNDGVKLTARVSNVFDADHSEVWGYPGQGRTAWLGLSADF